MLPSRTSVYSGDGGDLDSQPCGGGGGGGGSSGTGLHGHGRGGTRVLYTCTRTRVRVRTRVHRLLLLTVIWKNGKFKKIRDTST